MSAVLDLVPGLRRTGATSGGEYAGPCPWCGGKDRFHVWPEHPGGKGRWWCRRCTRSGDGIDLLRALKGMSFRQAAATMGQAARDGSFRRRPAAPRRAVHLGPPGTAWQRRAAVVACEAEETLWTPCGARALAYLRGRGFAEATIRGARLGYVPQDRREDSAAWGLPGAHGPVQLPRGVAIPWRAGGAMWAANIRRPAGDPKYIQIAGGRKGLYGVDGLRQRMELPAVLVEGEFDALAVAQAAYDLVHAVATGSTQGARHPRWVALLAASPVVLVAYDGDDAGETAAQWWLDRLPRARRLVPEGDPAAMLQAGHDVRAWLVRALR